MTPLLKSLLGNGSKDRELAEEMRAVLQEMQKERQRYERLVESSQASANRLQQLGEPMAKASGDMDAMTSRLGELEQRFEGMARLSELFQSLDERAETLANSQHDAEAQFAKVIDDSQHVRAVFEEFGSKVDAAMDLKDRLTTFLEIEKPFQLLRGEADAIRGQVEGTGEHLARIREQHERLIDAHKTAMSKMEALDRRRDDLGRSMQDKERRVASVEQAVRGMDGIQRVVDDVKRDMGTLKALGDTVIQKTAALEAQRDAIDRALAGAENLDRAMRQIDAGVRQQQDNEKALAALQDHVATLRSLHEAVIERSGEISQLLHETDEQMRATRQDLTGMTNEMRNTVERFDFESRGLESVHQRVADLRGALSDFETRFKTLSESATAVVELRSQTQALTTQLQALTEEVGHVDKEIVQLRSIRRDLDETGQIAQEIGANVARIIETRPTVEVAVRDLDQLTGAHTLVRDALEQTQIAHEEMMRVRKSQGETRTWLEGVERAVGELSGQVGELRQMAPAIGLVQKQVQHISEATSEFESRREFVDDLNRRVADLEGIGRTLDQRGQELQARMQSAEERFAGLEAHAEEAERLGNTIGAVTTHLREAGRKADEIKKTVTAVGARCESVEALAERTQTLRKELEQRQNALAETTEELNKASALRQEAATSAEQLGEVAKELHSALEASDKRVMKIDKLAAQLEDRAATLGSVQKRMVQFEERLSKWDLVEQEVSQSLEQIIARQRTVEALQADLDRMFALVEKTAGDVHEITSAQQEIEESRGLLKAVQGGLEEVRETATALDERKRQMAKAEERLSRADALLVEVRSSLEALEGQKAIVDQAVEKAGSLQFLLKQAEATIEGLREERKATARVRSAVAGVRQDDEGDGEETAQAA